MPDIEWRSVPGTREYEVSNLGTIRYRRADGSFLCVPIRNPRSIYPNGTYTTVSLWDSEGDGRYSGNLHILVLEAFVGPRPDGMLALHRDDNKRNNSLENLRWGTRSENIRDYLRNKTMRWAKMDERYPAWESKKASGEQA